MNKKKIRNDIILIAAVVLIAAIGFVLYVATRQGGSVVVVEIDGEFFGKYPLSEDASVSIDTERGHNLLIIENGRARIDEADCPDLICAEHAPILNTGETIVCLPNRVIVVIE